MVDSRKSIVEGRRAISSVVTCRRSFLLLVDLPVSQGCALLSVCVYAG
jgi:hypothetical protein